VGTTTTSFDVCFINGVPNTQWGNAATINPALPITINPGQNATVTITLTRGAREVSRSRRCAWAR
jgi:spore coat protein U-like protein